MKVIVKLGADFNFHDPNVEVGSCAIVERAQCGQSASANWWHAHLANNLLNLGFIPTQCDQDVWMRCNAKCDMCNCIGMHSDDLSVVSKVADETFEVLQKIHTIETVEEPKFHLGCDHMKINGKWHIGTTTCVVEALKKCIDILGLTRKDGESVIGVADEPMSTDLKPEMDKSPLLGPEGHRNFQQLMGIAQWPVTCGRTDIHCAVCSLSRFGAAPRMNHTKACKEIHRCLNGHQEFWTPIDSVDFTTMEDPKTGKLVELELPNKHEENVDWKMYYPHAQEMHGRELDLLHPKPKGIWAHRYLSSLSWRTIRSPQTYNLRSTSLNSQK